LTVLNQLFQPPFNDERIKLFNKLNRLLSQTSFCQKNKPFEIRREQEVTHEQEFEETAIHSTQITTSQLEGKIEEYHTLSLVEVNMENQDEKILLPNESYPLIQQGLDYFIDKMKLSSNQDYHQLEDLKAMVDIIDNLKELARSKHERLEKEIKKNTEESIQDSCIKKAEMIENPKDDATPTHSKG